MCLFTLDVEAALLPSNALLLKLQPDSPGLLDRDRCRAL